MGKGNFNKIISNTNRSLLKLNIALKFWESKNNQKNELKLDKIAAKANANQPETLKLLQKSKLQQSEENELIFKL